MQQLVTIIMATYNRAHFIIETLKSIQNQTYANWECIIIDDGGTDNTAEILQPVIKSDTRISFSKRPDKYKKGLPGCRNYGLDLAKGEYIVFFDDDDIVHPQLLELCVFELQNEKVDFCRYLRTVFRDEFHYQFDLSKNYTKYNINTSHVEAMVIHKLPFNSCAVVWNKKCFQGNRFVETLMYAEEWELYSRILSSGYKGVSIDKILFFGRKHPNSNTGEFFNNNPIRKKSKVDAVILVLDNLKEKGLLTDVIINHLVSTSIRFSEFNLFSIILSKADLDFKKTTSLQLMYYKSLLKYKLKRFLNR